MKNVYRSSILAWLFCALLASAAAQTVLPNDPTRPAAQWLAAQARPAGGDTAAPDPEPAGVQIIVMGAKRQFAVIDGQLIRVGESYQGARLLSIGSQGVLMQKDGAKADLRMNPAVRKKVYLSKPVRGGTEPGTIVLNGEGQ